jgi:hypothetical protein
VRAVKARVFFVPIACAIAAFVLYLAIAGIGKAQTYPWTRVKPRESAPWPASNPWISLWTSRDHDLRASEHVAAVTFGVSESWLRSCRSSEGGSTARETLRWSLRRAVYGLGWNTTGSNAFGPWQFMLDTKPAGSPREWGTFRRYVGPAFAEARRHRVFVPSRFKTPDSYVGQAMTAAFMFSIGQAGQWTGAGC